MRNSKATNFTLFPLTRLINRYFSNQTLFIMFMHANYSFSQTKKSMQIILCDGDDFILFLIYFENT